MPGGQELAQRMHRHNPAVVMHNLDTVPLYLVAHEST